MGVASIKGAIWTGHTDNVRTTGGSDFGSVSTPTSSHLFEQYDLGMATVLKDIHCRGLYSSGSNSDSGDVCIKDVTRSSTINSILMISGLTVDESIDKNLWFRHVKRDAIQGVPGSVQEHCNVRNNLAYLSRPKTETISNIVYPGPWNSPCGNTKSACQKACPGTSYSSQIVVIEVEDDSLKAALGNEFAEGTLLGGADTTAETGGTASSTNNWWFLDDRCKSETTTSSYSGGFTACPRLPKYSVSKFKTRTVVNILMFDLVRYLESNAEFLGNSQYGGLIPQGGAEPVPWAVSGTMYQFGQTSRRLQLNKGLAQVQGPCCDIGWYFAADSAPTKVLAIIPMRMVTEVGLMFATSYDKGAKITVKECSGPKWAIVCKSLPKLATLKEDTTESKWYEKTTSASKQVFLKVLNPDKNSFVDIGGTLMPFRSPANPQPVDGVYTNVWYEIHNTGNSNKPPLDLPPVMWSSSFG